MMVMMIGKNFCSSLPYLPHPPHLPYLPHLPWVRERCGEKGDGYSCN
jgi:hypothetical protein